MLLAGIQAEFGLDPPITTFGGDGLGVASLDPSRNFRRSTRRIRDFYIFKLRALRDLRGAICVAI
jgi:hypothetical protein